MTLKTMAATAAAPKEPFALREVELDEPAADEVLVRIEATPGCATPTSPYATVTSRSLSRVSPVTRAPGWSSA